MKRRFNRLRLPLWFSGRFFWLGGAVAALFALGAIAPVWEWVGAAAGAVLMLGIAIDALAGPSSSSVRVRRIVPDHLSLRTPGEFTYEIENASSRVLHVGIIETPTPHVQWATDELLATVEARERVLAVRSVVPRQRGRAHLSNLYVWYENALGLLRRRAVIGADSEVRIFPDLSAVERYGTLHARNRFVDAGLRAMRLRGNGTQFESLREWTAGDSFRSIDWKATARRGRTIVAQYEIERAQRLMIVLDAGRLMTARVGEQRKFDYAVTAALSLATIAGLASDAVGLVAFAQDIIVAEAPRAARASLAGLAERVHDLEPRFEESDYIAAFAYLRAHLHKRTLVVLFTDMIDPAAQASVLAEMSSMARHHMILCVFMNDAAIEARLGREPLTSHDVYETSVALALRAERSAAKAVLERLGVHTIDVPAERLTTTLIDEYLRVKTRGLL
ncbi:MAG: DUF58 domain-containing protein [Candidatus Eremiobacteraeota bacterium]|nr:DUF58 domain-containing protein [Candidatus Eremiobacteraeota bacterium]